MDGGVIPIMQINGITSPQGRGMLGLAYDVSLAILGVVLGTIGRFATNFLFEQSGSYLTARI